MRFPSRTTAIDTDDAGGMRFVSLRTRVLRAVLVTAAAVVLALAVWTARGLDAGTRGLLPGSTGVVVIDLSLSIGNEDYDAMRRTLQRLIDEDTSVGLVIFSDVPYELLPPGTPAAELRPLVRFLVPRRLGPPVNPWAGSFRAGTRISSALELAQEMLVRDRVKDGAILLLSDLITAPEDVPQLVRTLHALRLQSIAVRVVPLSPLKDGRTIFEGLLGKSALVAPSQIGGREPVWARTRVELPVAFLLLGALLLAVVATHEHFASRLGLPPAQEGHA